MSRLAPATATDIVATDRPFSSFAFTEAHFDGTAPIRRLFSLGRGHGARTLVIEDVPSAGAVEDENAELVAMSPDYRMADLKRISFWTRVTRSNCCRGATRIPEPWRRSSPRTTFIRCCRRCSTPVVEISG